MRNRHSERSNRRLFFRIFGALTIIALVWIIFFLPATQDDIPINQQNDTLAINESRTIPAEVSEFITFVTLSSDTVLPEETNIYAGMGVDQLSTTIESFIDRNSSSYHSMTNETEKMKEIAEELGKGKDEDNSEKTKKAFLIASDLLKNIQGIKNSEAIRSKAESIRDDVALEQQLENVKSYFVTVADEFRKMTGIKEKKCKTYS